MFGASTYWHASQDSYLILDTLPAEYDSRVKAMEVDEKPTEDYSDIGGLDKQIQELVEAIVLPVTHKVTSAPLPFLCYLIVCPVALTAGPIGKTSR